MEVSKIVQSSVARPPSVQGIINCSISAQDIYTANNNALCRKSDPGTYTASVNAPHASRSSHATLKIKVVGDKGNTSTELLQKLNQFMSINKSFY